MKDALKYKQAFTEEIDDEGNKYETFLEKSKKSKNQCVSIKYDINILGLNGPRKFKLYATEYPPIS